LRMETLLPNVQQSNTDVLVKAKTRPATDAELPTRTVRRSEIKDANCVKAITLNESPRRAAARTDRHELPPSAHITLALEEHIARVTTEKPDPARMKFLTDRVEPKDICSRALNAAARRPWALATDSPLPRRTKPRTDAMLPNNARSATESAEPIRDRDRHERLLPPRIRWPSEAIMPSVHERRKLILLPA
jgi:hypothetical protein